ncbi:MAG: hypothetical protein AAB321_03255 [Chloroflexota bacterium]
MHPGDSLPGGVVESAKSHPDDGFEANGKEARGSTGDIAASSGAPAA